MKSKKGIIISSIITLVVLLLAGYYLMIYTPKLGKDIVQNKALWEMQTKSGFSDPQDPEAYKQKIIELDKKISETTTGDATDLFIEKARYLDYLGETGKAIQIYEENIGNNKNDRYTAFLHNLAKLYEKVGRCDFAIDAYAKLIINLNKGEYYQDIAACYETLGNPGQAKKALAQYQKFISTDQTLNVLTK